MSRAAGSHLRPGFEGSSGKPIGADMEEKTELMDKDVKILVIDDEARVCELIKDTLSERYPGIDLSFNLSDALGKISNRNYDLIISDIKLPDGSGMDAISKAMEIDSFTEIIIITGYGTFELAARAVNIGVSAFHTKPIDMGELREQVEKCVYRRNFHLKSKHLMLDLQSSEYNEIREHIYNITSLYYFSNKLMKTTDIADTMEIILTEIMKIFDPEFCIIGANCYGYKEVYGISSDLKMEKDDYVALLKENWSSQLSVFNREELEQGLIPVNKYRYQEEDEGKQKEIKERGDNRDYNIIPLSIEVQGQKFGFIVLGYRDKVEFENGKLDFFHTLATIASSVINRGYMDEHMSRLARTDSLTNISNHRMFHQALNREIARSKRNGSLFSLAMIDIDDFKKVNDKYGHQTGDEILVHVVKTVSDEIRTGDFIARYGGEEFALILPESDIEGGKILAERVCNAVKAKPYNSLAGDTISSSVSIGVAEFNPENALNKDTLINYADDALYKAKRQGKNRVATIAGNDAKYIGEPGKF